MGWMVTIVKKELTWRLSYSDTRDGERSDWVKASVPGCVQLDMAKALGIPSYLTGDHEDEYTWMEDKFWHYRALAEIGEEGVPFLHFSGVEYRYEVLLNGETVLSHEGMFSGVDVELNAYRGQGLEIEVLLYPAPKRTDIPALRGRGNEASHSCKPAFSYSWDWCPRLVTLGIVDEAYIEYRPQARLEDVQFSYRLSDDCAEAYVQADYRATAGGSLEFALLNPQGERAEMRRAEIPAGTGSLSLTLENPELWWPHNHGGQPVYTASLALESGGQADIHRRHIGFRRIRLVVNEGEWAQPSTPIKTCSRPPMTVEINGRRIFVKGSNWVPPEMCRSQMEPERIGHMLDLLRDANMNAVRMWGGGYIHPDYFYDFCDARGILVWQEFPLACANYDGGDSYLAVLRQEADAIVRQLRTHPSLMLWSGGNELFNSWSMMTPQSKAIRLLNARTLELDPDTPFIPTSPIYGAGHGSYDMVCTNGREILTEFCEGRYTAYTEFGCGAPSEWEYLGTFMTEEERARPLKSPIWEKRHGLDSCDEPTRWFDIEGIRKISGCSDDPQEMVGIANEIQAVMYGCLFEETRRQWPHASMGLNWCYNEPWPTGAGNGLLNYPDIPRRCYYRVKEALQAQRLSLRFTRIAWRPGELLECQPWLLNDSGERLETDRAEIYLTADGVTTHVGGWDVGETPPYRNQSGESFCVTVPRTADKRFTLSIVSAAHPERDADYPLFVHDQAV